MYSEKRMQWGTLWRVLGLFLLTVGAWGEEDDDDNDAEYKVSISGIKVELTCPLDTTDEVSWDTKRGKKTGHTLTVENFSELDDSGYYTCYTTAKKHHRLYLKARVCENCLEVDLMTVVTVIIVDICSTLGLLLVVYYWSKNRKTKAKPVTRAAGAGGRPRGQNKQKPPPVPNPDYEPIRKGQRDLYAGLNHRGI